MLKQTPSQTVGPFFYDALIRKGENILANEQTKGQHIYIKGHVFDGDGQPIPDAMVEIWQPDAQGIFKHPADPRHAQADPAFRGFGRSDTSNGGQFCFETVKPGRVAWDDKQQQAPYVNVRLFSRGMLVHANTRLYFSDEQAANQDDPVLKMIDADRRQTLIAQFEKSNDLPTYCFNIVVQGEAETVFFTP